MVLNRLAGRRTCEVCGTNYSLDDPPADDSICDVCGGKVVQREDDTEAAISRRLEVYEERTAPLVAWYLVERPPGRGRRRRHPRRGHQAPPAGDRDQVR